MSFIYCLRIRSKQGARPVIIKVWDYNDTSIISFEDSISCYYCDRIPAITLYKDTYCTSIVLYYKDSFVVSNIFMKLTTKFRTFYIIGKSLF